MRPLQRYLPGLAFVVVFAAALTFALGTNHVWEDYYITFRSSRNLATGHGLVFNHGDRLHTFTSPLGVLLPAASYLATGNSSDVAALWIFRVICSAALGGAAALLVALTLRLRYAAVAVAFVAAAIATDAKSLDFTINGMETAFMLLFLALAVWAQLRPGPRQAVWLGLAWGGLMWTRPDSFVYVGLVGAGFWLFNDPARSGRSRVELLKVYAVAAGITTLLYGPWLLWAAWYYGTPVPFTIAAKGSIGHAHTGFGLLGTALALPWLAWAKSATLELTFLPSYFVLGGWPAWLVLASRTLACLAALLWVVPRLRTEVRAASFAFFGAHVYLTYFPYFPFPWYVPATTLLAVVALGGALAQWAGDGGRVWRRRLAWATVIAFLAGAGWTTLAVGRQVAAQQRIVEDGTRRRIGEWLHDHAAPGDAVFMEPLGYIGYFSGLKTYDYPGMSSREMVAARRRFGEEWGRLLFALAPRWVVLRPFEVERIRKANPKILGDHYEPVRDFDHTAEVKALPVRGRPYLEHDAHFTVFELKRPFSFETKVKEVVVPFPTTKSMVEGHNMTLMHAPSRMVVFVPALARRVTGHFCIMPAAIEGDAKTDGAEFRISLRSGSRTQLLLRRYIDPAKTPADRPVQSYAFELPSDRADDAELVYEIQTGPTATKDWTCWDDPDFR